MTALGDAVPGEPAPRLAALDGLRFVAALFVVLFHYTGMNAANWTAGPRDPFPLLSQVTRHGWTGVHLFFLISGYVICMSAWGGSLGGFAVSRLTRLYPAYWFAATLTAIVVASTEGLPLYLKQVSWSEFAVNLTMLQAPLRIPNVDPPYWSLWPELQFYLLFGVVVWRGVTYRRVLAFCGLWTIGALAAVGSGDALLTFVFMPRHAPYFIAGVIFHLIRRHGPNLVLWGLIGVCWAQAQYYLRVGFDGPGRVPAILGTVYFVLLATIALGWLDWVRGRWLLVAGTLTYPLYLIHQGIGWILILHLSGSVPRWLLLGGLLVTMLAAAWLIHRLVERPLAPRLRRALTRAVAQIRAAPSPSP